MILLIWKSGRGIQECIIMVFGLYMTVGWRGGVKIRGLDNVSETESHFVLINVYGKKIISTEVTYINVLFTIIPRMSIKKGNGSTLFSNRLQSL